MAVIAVVHQINLRIHIQLGTIFAISGAMRVPATIMSCEAVETFPMKTGIIFTLNVIKYIIKKPSNKKISFPIIKTAIAVSSLKPTTCAFVDARRIQALVMRSLSAVGSRNEPNLVTVWVFLAMQPSMPSLIAIIRKIAVAMYLSRYLVLIERAVSLILSMAIIKGAISRILRIVIRFAQFSFIS